MDSRHRSYADEMHKQSLSRIRERISGFCENRYLGSQTGTSTSSSFQSSKSHFGGFTGKLQSLDKECQKVLENIHELNAQKRKIETRFNQLKEDLLKTLEIQQASRKLGISELSTVIKEGISASTERNRRIEESYYENLGANNKIKINLVQLRNKINEIQHRLGTNATIWQKI